MPWFDGTTTGRSRAQLEKMIISRGVTGNRVSFMGDSIAIGNSNFTGTNRLRGDKDPLNWASLLSNSRVNYRVNAGISGNTSAQMLARIGADIITPGCDVCLIMAGTNDAPAVVSVSSYASNITQMIKQLRDNGIMPVLCTIPPQPTTPVTNPTRRRSWDLYNSWLAAYSQRTGIALVPVASKLTDPATGAYLAAYDGGDGIHPNAAGAKVIGQAIADTITSLLAPWAPPVSIFQTADASNMLAGGLFLVDTNADGTSDNWAKSGNAVASRITNDATILGTWQRLVDTVNEFSQITATNVTTGYAVGDVLALSGRVKNDSVGGQVSFTFGLNGSGLNVRPLSGFSVAVPDAQFYMEMVVPVGTTSVNAGLLMQSSTSLDARMAQMNLVNLTTLGLTA